ncbi:protein of unknown function [Streptantibioticus cattleyicolor NRRL 8057 = DSM 46488]|nr:protein of unknown function [Streptantibioticus cattleyicolor NRRL 8057 = DSM 46488]
MRSSLPLLAQPPLPTASPHIGKRVTARLAPRTAHDGYVGCDFSAQPPFQLTKNGAIQISGSWGACTTPAPQSCYVELTLQRANPYGSWSTVWRAGGKWGKCSGRVGSAYKCTTTGQKSTWNIQEDVVVEYNGRQSDPQIADTATSYIDCA